MSAAHTMTGAPLDMSITPLERAARIYWAYANAQRRHLIICRKRCANAQPCRAINRYARQIEAISLSYDALVSLEHPSPPNQAEYIGRPTAGVAW